MSDEMMKQSNGSASNALAQVPHGVLAKEEFGSRQVMRAAETAAAAVAAQAEAAVKARYSLALLRPRDFDDVRIKLKHECARRGFAEVARYSKPVGGQSIEGWSIRFAESAMRVMGNLMPETTVVYDDDKCRIVRVALTDLEANCYHVKDVVVSKTVERKKLKNGQKPIASRINSYGDPVYIVPATDDEVLTKENALCSKALRNHVLRIVPGDLLDECLEWVTITLNTEAADPDAARKKLADAFAALNVMPSDLKEYLGHDLGQSTPAELVALRKVHAAIKTGEASWSEILDQRQSEKKDETKKDEAPIDAKEPAKNLGDLKKRAKAETKPKITSEGDDGVQRPVVDENDSGPCLFDSDGSGPCGHEGPNYIGIGYRCGKHVPEVKG